MLKNTYKFTFVIAILLLLNTGLLQAQVNTESLRKSNQDAGSHVTLGADFAYMQGNSRIFRSRLKGRLDLISLHSHLFLVADQMVSSKDKSLFINKGFAHARLIKPFRNPVAGEAFAQQEYNEFIHLSSRSLIGAGLRVGFPQREKAAQASDAFNMNLGLGLMLEREDIDAGADAAFGDPVHGDLAQLLRSTNYLVLNFKANDTFRFLTTTYYQVDTRRLADFRVLSNSLVALKITKNLSLTMELDIRYDSEPPAEVDALDLEFTQGLSYSFVRGSN